MKKFLSKIKALKPTKRKLMQLYFALLFNANLKGFATGNIYQGDTKKICVPGMNCYSCPGAVGACPLGSLEGSFSAGKSTMFYVGGILLLYSILFGRMICGWLCPFGLVQELLYKIKTPKIKKSPVTRVLSFLKYAFLVLFVFVIPIIYAFRDTPLPAFCKYICPAGTLEGGISLLANKVNASYFSMLGPLFTWKFLLLVGICLACIFIFRMFCRFICPLGALYGLFNKISVFGVKIEESKCTHCNLCKGKCKMDIKKVGDSECIACGDCVSVCPTNAIVWKGVSGGKKKSLADTVSGKKTARTVTRSIVAILMAAVLAGAVIYYWNLGDKRQPDPGTNNGSQVVGDNGTSSDENEVKYGSEVGDLCYGADLDVITEPGSTVDPTKTGKITIINFWGTWCTPCVKELPYFDQIATDYDGVVDVIAIHTDMMAAETAGEYIANYYPDSKLIFAKDLVNEEYYSMLGGRGTYPYTVILNESGEVVEVFVKALEYEDLAAVVERELDK